VLSIATVQHHLDMTGGGRSVEMAPYLSRLCATLAESMIDSGGLVSLTVRAGAGGIAIKQAENIGLIVTELVINALKHAFPAGRGGEVRITYDVAKAGWRLSVSDNGVGGQESDGARMNSGVGTRIVRMLAQELDARVEMSSGEDGTTVAMTHGTVAPSAHGPTKAAA
jgi:chemotaxis protein methyltransferase CheR